MWDFGNGRMERCCDYTHGCCSGSGQQKTIEAMHFDAFGNELNPGSASGIRPRYTGESHDSTTGLYHLRARDYDPHTGRFISMDEHPGSQRIPLTLNKYLYANADPINHIDPSGFFGLGGVGVSMGSMGRSFSVAMPGLMGLLRTFSFAAGRAAIGAMTVSAVHIGTFAIANTLARRCLKNGTIDRNCNPGFNIFVVGDLATPEHHGLVTKAIGVGAPFSLTRRIPAHDRSWLRKLGCRGSRDEDLDCDEYPYASSHQGGEYGLSTFYKIASSDNRRAGNSLGAMYRKCGIKGGDMLGDQYFVLPIKGAPTVGLCGK